MEELNFYAYVHHCGHYVSDRVKGFSIPKLQTRLDTEETSDIPSAEVDAICALSLGRAATG